MPFTLDVNAEQEDVVKYQRAHVIQKDIISIGGKARFYEEETGLDCISFVEEV